MERVLRSWQAAVLVLAALLVQGCSATTQFVAKSPGTTLEVGGSGRVVLPQSRKMSSKSTGQYEFRAVSADGKEMYGILPMRVSGGKMATSILLFAPALFIGGFRDVFHFYEFDPDNGTIGYKSREGDEWRFYRPTAAESDRSREYFRTKGAESQPASGATN